MAIPKVIFIDTSIFDEQCYNFSSSSMSAFIKAARARSLILLMPDTTKREIQRHISDISETALKALEEAKRRAPFLVKWKGWPSYRSIHLIKDELVTLANSELKTFLANFKVVDLDYSDINLHEIMNWYDKGRAPFGPKKQKEFPDAFAIASIITYSNKNECQVAIVSKDNDFMKVCSYYMQLHAFPSLTSLTELLLSENKRLSSLKILLNNNLAILSDSLIDSFCELSFYPEEEPGGDVEDISVSALHLDDLRIIAIGNTEFTVSFDATINYSADVSYTLRDYDDDNWGYEHHMRGNVSEELEISGIAKLLLNSLNGDIEEVNIVEFETDEISVNSAPDEIFDYEMED